MSLSEATPKTVSLTLDRALLRGIGLTLAGAVVLALTGAFGMDEVPLWFRLAYWIPVMILGAVWGHLCGRLVERYIAGRGRRRRP